MTEEFARELRVGARLMRLLNELLQFQVKDPRLAGVRVTDVSVSGDLGVAKVYYSPLEPDSDEAELAAAFARANGFLRSRAGHALGLRRVPELRFYLDDAAKHGMEIDRLIDDSLKEHAGQAEGQGAEHLDEPAKDR